MIDVVMSIPVDQVLFGAASGYVAGSILGSDVVGMLMPIKDIRKIGSGNPGATNMLRTGHRGAAVATLVIDMMKGALAFWLGHYLWGSDAAAWMAGLGVILGHLYPCWRGFAGGKGVATFFGVTLAASSPVFGLTALLWIGFALFYRRSSAASLAATLFAAGYMAVDVGGWALVMVLMSGLIWWRHSDNLVRLMDGSEPEIAWTAKGRDHAEPGEQ